MVLNMPREEDIYSQINIKTPGYFRTHFKCYKINIKSIANVNRWCYKMTMSPIPETIILKFNNAYKIIKLFYKMHRLKTQPKQSLTQAWYFMESTNHSWAIIEYQLVLDSWGVNILDQSRLVVRAILLDNHHSIPSLLTNLI